MGHRSSDAAQPRSGMCVLLDNAGRHLPRNPRRPPRSPSAPDGSIAHRLLTEADELGNPGPGSRSATMPPRLTGDPALDQSSAGIFVERSKGGRCCLLLLVSSRYDGRAARRARCSGTRRTRPNGACTRRLAVDGVQQRRVTAAKAPSSAECRDRSPDMRSYQGADNSDSRTSVRGSSSASPRELPKSTGAAWRITPSGSTPSRASGRSRRDGVVD